MGKINATKHLKLFVGRRVNSQMTHFINCTKLLRRKMGETNHKEMQQKDLARLSEIQYR